MTHDFAAYPSLKGACAFVTGGATGIGASIVRAHIPALHHSAYLPGDKFGAAKSKFLALGQFSRSNLDK